MAAMTAITTMTTTTQMTVLFPPPLSAAGASLGAGEASGVSPPGYS